MYKVKKLEIYQIDSEKIGKIIFRLNCLFDDLVERQKKNAKNLKAVNDLVEGLASDTNEELLKDCFIRFDGMKSELDLVKSCFKNDGIDFFVQIDQEMENV